MAISHAHLMLLLFLSLFFLPSLHGIVFKDCGDGTSPVKVTSVDTVEDTDTDMAGFQITGSTNETITGGTTYVRIKLGFIFVKKELYHLCEYMACPIEPGSFVLPFEKFFHSMSQLKYHVYINILDDSVEEQQIVCLTFDFQPKSSKALSV